jgi:hypothetical protein
MLAGAGLKAVFDPDNKQWAEQHQELKALLTPDEYKAARASILNAHYTSTTVVGAMFDARLTIASASSMAGCSSRRSAPATSSA